MHLDWVLNPAVLYAAVALGMVPCLLLFISIKRDLQVCESRWLKKYSEMEAEMSARLATLEERCKELAEVSNLLVPPAPPRSGFNLNKRSQALQMFRRGETPHDISAALSIPLNEVDLLVKVQKLMGDNAGAWSAANGS